MHLHDKIHLLIFLKPIKEVKLFLISLLIDMHSTSRTKLETSVDFSKTCTSAINKRSCKVSEINPLMTVGNKGLKRFLRIEWLD